MTDKEKQLLLKDLSARLPYGVKCKVKYIINNETTYGRDVESECIDAIKKISFDACSVYTEWLGYETDIEDIKPYLRPMSSMTEEERKEFSKLLDRRYCEEDWEGHISISYCIEIDNVYTDDGDGIKYPTPFSMTAIDWLNEHHFDYRGLIEKGLAIEVTEDNNPYKE